MGKRFRVYALVLLGAGVGAGGWYAYGEFAGPVEYARVADKPALREEERTPPWPQELDRARYDERLLALAGVPRTVATTTITAQGTTTTQIPNPKLLYAATTNVTAAGSPWPAAAPYPHGGAILPFQRIIAYYGNFYSTRMGILGELPREDVLARLASTSAAWEEVDPETKALPAIHYIAMVAQNDAGAGGMYRAVMPRDQIEEAYGMAREIEGVLFLDLQVGLSTLERELPQFREYFTRPDVHLAVDPEFSMKRGNPPGTVIGTYSAADINFAIDWLAEIVREHKLPPKVLVVHRFTQNMVTDYEMIRPRPEVQVVVHMDGWGSKWLKQNTYRHVVEAEPVQFAGLKIFYKHDRKPPSTGIFTPEEGLGLRPKPVYIQYQ